MSTRFEVNGSVVTVYQDGKPPMDVPYRLYPDGSMLVGNLIKSPPPDSNKPMEHGDGSGGGGGGAGQSKKRTRKDGRNVASARPASMFTLSAITHREQNAMGLAWKMVKNDEGAMERRLELVAYQARAGQGKKKKPDGEKKKGKKKNGGQPSLDGDGAIQRGRNKPKRGGKREISARHN